jgi:hypothetical protein
MKRIFAASAIVLTLLCLLCFAVSAAPSATLSEDLQTLTIKGKTYSPGDISLMPLYMSDDTHIDLQLPKALEKELKTYKVLHNEGFTVLSVELYYPDGSLRSIPFVADTYSSPLWKLNHDDTLEVAVNNYWNDYQKINATVQDLKGKPIHLFPQKLISGHYLEVRIYSKDFQCDVYRGAVYASNDLIYYVDYLENNIVDTNAYYAFQRPELQAYEVTDPAVRQNIIEAVSHYNTYVNEDDQLELNLSAIFLCFVFAAIPLMVLIPSAIFTCRSKGYYRITWGITAGICIVELCIFAVMVLSLLQK